MRRQQLIEKFGALKKKDLQKEYKKMFPSAFSTKSKQVEEDAEGDWQDDPDWVSYTSPLLDGLEWTVKPNPLLEDPTANADDDYQGLVNMTSEIQFILPFYNSDESMSPDAENETLNDILDDLFSVSRIKKRILSLRNQSKRAVKKLNRPKTQ